MTSKTWVAGTVIDSPWLQDVNDFTYGIGSLTTAAKGAGYVGAEATLNYTAKTIGATVFDGLVNVMWFLTQAERLDVKAGTFSIDLTSKINAAKTWAGNRPLYMPTGGWSFSTLDFKGNTGGIIGDGVGNTNLKVRSSVAQALDFNNVADANPRTYILKGFTLDGNGGLAAIGINVKYCHQAIKDDLFVAGCGIGIKESDTYTCHSRNVRSAGNGTGWWLVGSNHASTHVGCTTDTNTVCNWLIQINGVANDGNEALGFDGCVNQTTVGTATGWDITCSSAFFKNCYAGENNAGSAGIIMRGGLVTFEGGTMYFGFSGTSYGVTPLGGRIVFKGTNINSQGGSVQLFAGGGTGGTFKCTDDCQFNSIVSGTPSFTGDVLGYGPQGVVYAERLGKNWTGQGFNLTLSSVISGNKQTFTALTAPGPTPLLGAKCALTNSDKWRDGETLSMVLVFESSKPVVIRTSAGAFGAPVLTFASGQPATSGTPVTALCFQTTATNAAATLVEVNQTSSIVGDTLVIYECFLTDSRTLNKGAGQVGNLYKC